MKKKDLTPEEVERKRAYQREWYRTHLKKKEVVVPPGAVRGEARPRDPGPLPPGDPEPRVVHIHLPPTPDLSKEFEKIEKFLQEVHADLKEIVILLRYQVQKGGGQVINSGRKQ